MKYLFNYSKSEIETFFEKYVHFLNDKEISIDMNGFIKGINRTEPITEDIELPVVLQKYIDHEIEGLHMICTLPLIELYVQELNYKNKINLKRSEFMDLL